MGRTGPLRESALRAMSEVPTWEEIEAAQKALEEQRLVAADEEAERMLENAEGAEMAFERLCGLIHMYHSSVQA